MISSSYSIINQSNSIKLGCGASVNFFLRVSSALNLIAHLSADCASGYPMDVGMNCIRNDISCRVRNILLISIDVSKSLINRPLVMLRNELSLRFGNEWHIKRITPASGTQMHNFLYELSGMD